MLLKKRMSHKIISFSLPSHSVVVVVVHDNDIKILYIQVRQVDTMRYKVRATECFCYLIIAVNYGDMRKKGMYE